MNKSYQCLKCKKYKKCKRPEKAYAFHRCEEYTEGAKLEERSVCNKKTWKISLPFLVSEKI